MMMLRQGLVLLLQFLLLHAVTNKLCPASSSSSYSRHGNHHYPLDVFFPTVFNEPNVTCIGYLEGLGNLSCPIRTVGCPLVAENFRDAVIASRDWQKSTSLCPLKETLSNRTSTSRFIVLGGSVTVGVDSMGCCDKHECFHEPCRRCSWVHHIEHWLHTSTRANVTVHNLGNPGTTSVFSAKILFFMLREKHLSNLSSDDVILIDHSFNDNTLGIVPVEAVKLAKGLEELIRGLYSMAVSLDNLPYIILLATDTRVMGSVENRYTTRYRNLAQHYGLRYYSVADALASNASMTKQAAYHDYLTHVKRVDAHPPWFVHLAYADLFAGLLKSEMDECTSTTATTSNSGSKPYVLPAPMTPIDAANLCIADRPPLVKITHRDLMSNTAIGSFSVPRNNTWAVKLDHKKRGGIIIEVDKHSDFNTMEYAPLEINLGVTVEKFRQMNTMLQLQYLRSYADSGIVGIYLCGIAIRDLDALWVDYQHYHYTQQDAFSDVLNSNFCENQPANDTVVLRLLYKVIGNKHSVKAVPPRGTQMFKINSILVCEYQPVTI